ncbi:aminoglycoside 6'-N-acetyltransferase [Nocardia sp. NPDC052278]|uniref:aminoglycoside 6'-N-acetyltransferase n=1 Tax=unclassified Nocardia TaxID=2637762 RepID=UPI003685A246
MRIDRYCDADLDVLAGLRARLWPDGTVAEHRAEVEETYDGDRTAAAFLARGEDGTAIGFSEATLRTEYVNGCDSSPVAFLEGIYVEPNQRRSGAARALCAAVEEWGRELGCTELGSDALTDNSLGHELHKGLGFEERERVIYYRKLL